MVDKLKISNDGHDLEIAYLHRPGPKGAILYLHGIGCAKDDFNHATSVDGLRAYTLVSFDFPGCGHSPYPEGRALGIDDLVTITTVLVSTLDLAEPVLIGHSVGGIVALLYALRHQDTVQGVVSVEGNLGPEDCYFTRKVMEHDYAGFRDHLFPKLKQKLASSENRGFRIHAQILDRYCSPRALFDYCPSVVHYSDRGQLLQRFIDLPLPTLFVYGSETPTVPYLQHLKEARCPVAEIPNSRHFPGYDNPTAFYGTIAKFVSSCAG